MQNGWSVNNPDAYPVVARRDPGGIPRPLVERGRRDRRRLRPGAQRLHPQACCDLQGRHLHPGLRVVLRRRGPRGSLHRSPARPSTSATVDGSADPESDTLRPHRHSRAGSSPLRPTPPCSPETPPILGKRMSGSLVCRWYDGGRGMASPQCASGAAPARRAARVHLRHADHFSPSASARTPRPSVSYTVSSCDRLPYPDSERIVQSGTGLGRTAEGSDAVERRPAAAVG